MRKMKISKYDARNMNVYKHLSNNKHIKIFFISIYRSRSGSERFRPIGNHLLTLIVIKM